jgi:hypothetical protein
MPAPKAEKIKLGPEEAHQMKQLTDELRELITKMAKIVRSSTGSKDAPYNIVTLILQSGDNPLQVGFQNSRILNVQAAAHLNAKEQDEIGYYIDPPGVCTTVPACIPY